jgi:hypothetical protein
MSFAAQIAELRRYKAYLAWNFGLEHPANSQARAAYLAEYNHWTMAAQDAAKGDTSPRPFITKA